MTVEDLVKYFMEASISGASKTQVRRTFKKLYNLNDEQIDKLQELAKFKRKPKKINYKNFYKNNITKKNSICYLCETKTLIHLQTLFQEGLFFYLLKLPL